MISGAAKVFEFLVGSGAVIVPVLLACAFFYIICVLFGAKEDAQGDVIAETNASCAVSERHAGQEDMNAVKNEYCEAESSRIERGAGFAMSFASARIYNEEKVCGYGPRGRALRPEGGGAGAGPPKRKRGGPEPPGSSIERTRGWWQSCCESITADAAPRKPGKGAHLARTPADGRPPGNTDQSLKRRRVRDG